MSKGDSLPHKYNECYHGGINELSKDFGSYNHYLVGWCSWISEQWKKRLILGPEFWDKTKSAITSSCETPFNWTITNISSMFKWNFWFYSRMCSKCCRKRKKTTATDPLKPGKKRRNRCAFYISAFFATIVLLFITAGISIISAFMFLGTIFITTIAEFFIIFGGGILLLFYLVGSAIIPPLVGSCAFIIVLLFICARFLVKIFLILLLTVGYVLLLPLVYFCTCFEACFNMVTQ